LQHILHTHTHSLTHPHSNACLGHLIIPRSLCTFHSRQLLAHHAVQLEVLLCQGIERIAHRLHRPKRQQGKHRSPELANSMRSVVNSGQRIQKLQGLVVGCTSCEHGGGCDVARVDGRVAHGIRLACGLCYGQWARPHTSHGLVVVECFWWRTITGQDGDNCTSNGGHRVSPTAVA
jgi:hypothetical protein